MRILNYQERIFTTNKIIELLRTVPQENLKDKDTFLVFNGGTGTGKTHAVMTCIKDELTARLGYIPKVMVVESRTMTVEQTNVAYTKQIDTFGGIQVKQRLEFMNIIKKGTLDCNWVIIDECHGLFSEASFAEDASFIANWIKSPERTAHIIFITACDQYFDDLQSKIFPHSFNLTYLFPDFTEYVSGMMVKQIYFIKTSNVTSAIDFLSKNMATKKGIYFLRSAKQVFEWYDRLFKQNINAGMIVSLANETKLELATVQKTMMEQHIEDYEPADGKQFTMADMCAILDMSRERQGLEPIRTALINRRIPDDINVLLATDTIQEGVNIESHVDYMIIEDCDDVGVIQKRGRFRGNLDTLYIVFNPSTTRRRLLTDIAVLNHVNELYEKGDQVTLAEEYGAQVKVPNSAKSIQKVIKEDGTVEYRMNQEFYHHTARKLQHCDYLISEPEAAAQNLFGMLSPNNIQMLTSGEIKDGSTEEKLREIANNWAGIPLKGKAQELLIQEFKDAHIMNDARRPVDTFVKCCNILKKYNIDIIEKRATKQDVLDYPLYLTAPREKFKIINI